MTAKELTNEDFVGWMGLDKDSAQGKMVWQQFPNPKKWEETDVDIEISCCGICGSDIHTLRSGWGPTPYRMFMVIRPACRKAIDTDYTCSCLRRP